MGRCGQAINEQQKLNKASSLRAENSRKYAGHSNFSTCQNAVKLQKGTFKALCAFSVEPWLYYIVTIVPFAMAKLKRNKLLSGLDGFLKIGSVGT